MRRLTSFMNISLDGYYADKNSDMTWAHKSRDDQEWNEFTMKNASGGGSLLFGRVTYDLMIKFWPTATARQQMPVVADGMNRAPKFVASRTLENPTWENTTVISGDLVSEIATLKKSDGPGIAILGSGAIVTQLADAGLIDEFQVAIAPTALGAGKPLFGGVQKALGLKLIDSRVFKNGNVFSRYSPAA